jgi:hypothetical protein
MVKKQSVTPIFKKSAAPIEMAAQISRLKKKQTVPDLRLTKTIKKAPKKPISSAVSKARISRPKTEVLSQPVKLLQEEP